jgi:2,4-dienoyl-CoA reductase-like NADH-dependent reductase (Old Yellow Enzyme family)/thioredoxin reductase
MAGLFEPLQLGPVELPNRIVSTSHQTSLVHDHLPTDALVAYHAERARGGAGLIVLEATAVVPDGLLTPHTVAGFGDGIVPWYRRIAEAAHAHGARVFTQLLHGGREVFTSAPRAVALGPSAVPSQRLLVEPGELTREQISELIDGFARCAARAAEGGLDGVEISAAHNYLAAQFFTPGVNRRTDEWACGPRFLLAVLERVRAAAPDLAIGVRMSGDSEAARAVASEVAAHVDYISLALGDSSTYPGSSDIVPPPPGGAERIAATVPAFRHGKPVIATSRIAERADAERLVADGTADAVGMTRALITDPELPLKLRDGREAEVLRCIGCNACIAHYHAGTPIACAMNPRTGRETELPPTVTASDRRRIVVVGAGPAGLAAAADAAAAGHEVVVLERAEEPGGQMALAKRSPGHAEVAERLLDNQRRLIERHGVDLRLGAAAEPDTIAALSPDLVIAATGARPYEPPLDLSGVPALQAWDVLTGAEPAGRRVVVCDWGGDHTGIAVAEALAPTHEVTLAVAAPEPAAALHQYQRNRSLARLYRAGARLVLHVQLAGTTDGEVVLRNVFARDLETRLAADALVLALGRVPSPAPDVAGVPVVRVGDCRSPRGLEEAILEGTLAARQATRVMGRTHPSVCGM